MCDGSQFVVGKNQTSAGEQQTPHTRGTLIDRIMRASVASAPTFTSIHQMLERLKYQYPLTPENSHEKVA